MSASLNKAPFRLQHPVVESDREIAPQGQMSATPSPGYPHICSSDASSTPSHLSGKPGSAECLRWQNGIRLGLRRLFDTKRAGRLFCGSRECVGLSLRMPAFGWLHCHLQPYSYMTPPVILPTRRVRRVRTPNLSLRGGAIVNYHATIPCSNPLVASGEFSPMSVSTCPSHCSHHQLLCFANLSSTHSILPLTCCHEMKPMNHATSPAESSDATTSPSLQEALGCITEAHIRTLNQLRAHITAERVSHATRPARRRHGGIDIYCPLSFAPCAVIGWRQLPRHSPWNLLWRCPAALQTFPRNVCAMHAPNVHPLTLTLTSLLDHRDRLRETTS